MNKRLLILLFAGAVALVLLLTSNGSGQEPTVHDSDGDGFSDGYELYLGTSPLTACLRDDVDPSVRGWPPDTNNDGTVDITDIVEIGSHFGKSVSYYYSWYLRRYDVTPEPMGDGMIDIADIIRAGAFFGRNCSG